MSRDKWRNAAFDVILDMVELHNPCAPDLPKATITRNNGAVELTLSNQDTGTVLGAWKVVLVSLKQTDEWTHVIMRVARNAVVVSRHRSAKSAYQSMDRRGMCKAQGYEIYRLVGNTGAVEVGDKLATTVDEDGNYLAFRPGSTI